MSQDNPTGKDLTAMLQAQGYRCALTGRELTPKTATLDHKIPVSKSGTHTLDNLWIIEHSVNRAKGVLTVDEFVAICLDVAKWYGSDEAARVAENVSQKSDGSLLTLSSA